MSLQPQVDRKPVIRSVVLHARNCFHDSSRRWDDSKEPMPAVLINRRAFLLFVSYLFTDAVDTFLH